MELEMVALEHLALEEVCSEYEINEVVRLNDGAPEDGPKIVAAWESRGWIERIEQEDELPQLLRLTDQAYRDQPWLPRAS